MHTAKLMTSVLSAWGMAIAYEQIEVATGIEIRVLLAAAVITMAAGFYYGLRTNK